VVRRFVAGVIARMADDETVKQLIALANDGAAPPARRAGAGIALGLLPKPSNPAEAAGALQGLMGVNDSTEVRVAAADALGRLGVKESVATLIGKVRDPEPDVMIAVLRALSKIKAAEAVAPVSELLKTGPAITDPAKADKKDEVLEFAAQALGDIGSADGIPALAFARAHPRRIVWETAQKSINAIVQGDKAALGKLLDWATGEAVLKNQPLPYLRAAACRALADLGDARGAEGLDALISRILDKNYPKEIHDYDVSVRLAAAEGLVKAGSDKGAPALVACLKDGTGLPTDNKDIRLIAAAGLDKIVSGDKPAAWAPAEAKTPEANAKEAKRWQDFVIAWQVWLEKKQGTASK